MIDATWIFGNGILNVMKVCGHYVWLKRIVISWLFFANYHNINLANLWNIYSFIFNHRDQKCWRKKVCIESSHVQLIISSKLKHKVDIFMSILLMLYYLQKPRSLANLEKWWFQYFSNRITERKVIRWNFLCVHCFLSKYFPETNFDITEQFGLQRNFWIRLLIFK